MENNCDKWNRLLSMRRPDIVASKVILKEDSNRTCEKRIGAERDYNRILFSAAFRRLAGKTQVRPFSDVDAIHNRLTHSIEVASVCYTLAHEIGLWLIDKGYLKQELLETFCWVAQTAGLAHDIGNPPYGHAGESAIQYWYKAYPKERLPCNTSSVWHDIEIYDGNAQTFHMLCNPEPRDSAYFRVTAATLGAVVKYPKIACQVGNVGPFKFDVFSCDELIFRAVWDELGLIKADGNFARHPISYIAEAADDICYHALDFEDAVTLGVLSENLVKDYYSKAMGEENDEKHKNDPLQKLRGRAVRRLVEAFVKCFESNYDRIMNGALAGDLKSLLEDGDGAKTMLAQMDADYKVLFSERLKVINETPAYSQIPIILSRYTELLDELNKSRVGALYKEYKNLSPFSMQLVNLAWGEKYYTANRHQPFPWWVHLVLDYIAGMTDAYAANVSGRLNWAAYA